MGSNYPSYEECDDSPVLPDDEPGLLMCLADGELAARLSRDSPWIVHGTFRVSGAALVDFEGAPERHVILVAAHRDSRVVYTGRVLKDDPPVPNLLTGQSRGGQITLVEGFFNVDVRAQCRIPGASGRYWVFAVLGPWVSPSLEIDV